MKAMISFFNNNFQVPKRPYAVFISNKDFGSTTANGDGEKPNNIPSCRACGNRRMEPLEGEGVYICCGCGKRVPMSMFQPPTAATKQGVGGEAGGGIKVVNTQSGSGNERGRDKIAFAQPKHQSAKDWFKRKHDPKNNGKYDADDIALMNSRSGVTITHTFEITRYFAKSD
jgi:hypothetical protein